MQLALAADPDKFEYLRLVTVNDPMHWTNLLV